MSYRFDAETLYNLLPEFYRLRDAQLAQDDAQGGPLRQFIEVLAEQAMVVEENTHQLYDDQFIETSAEWVIPYIGDLIGARLIEMPKDDDDLGFSQRAQVANTIPSRRRKGTAGILEQVARDVTGFPARVVEFFQLVATTQYMNHLRLNHIVTLDLRNPLALEELDSPFTTIPRTPDMREIQTGRGKYNLSNIGIFLWRLGVYPLSNIPAFEVDSNDNRRFMFNPLGINTQLYNVPQSEELITALAEPIHTPHPISRLRLRTSLNDYFQRAMTIFVDGNAVDVGTVQVCNLSDAGGGDWLHSPQDRIGVDPVLGRIHFPVNSPPPQSVSVTFHMPYVMAMGGGEYTRDVDTPDNASIVRVNTVLELNDGVDTMRLEDAGGIVEVVDSHTYDWNPGGTTFIGVDSHLIVRASQSTRPLINLATRWDIQGMGNSRVTLDGLCFAGNQIRIMGRVDEVVIRHCTFVPGITLDIDGTPQQPDTPALVIRTSVPCSVTITHSIVGGLRVDETSNLTMRNSILDATADDQIAYAASSATPAQRRAGGKMSLDACTIRGAVYTTEMDEVSNCIIKAEAPDPTPAVLVQRQQVGCIRYSYHPTQVRLPRRYKCVPNDLSESVFHPIFTSERYGTAGYFQLNPETPAIIRTGASDGEEMGAYHDVYQNLRERNLHYRLDEYLRFGLKAGVFYVS